MHARVCASDFHSNPLEIQAEVLISRARARSHACVRTCVRASTRAHKRAPPCMHLLAKVIINHNWADGDATKLWVCDCV
jgi:hypothetical protein